MSVILGVDPGLTRCGFGLLKDNKPLNFGVFTTTPDMPAIDRVGTIATQLEELVSTYKPTLIALERVFAQANLKSVMGVAQISGALMAIAYRHQIPLEFFTPSEVKLAVTGSGRADKAQVGMMVAKTLNLQEIPKPADVADALAVALCASKRARGQGTKAQQKWVAAAKTANTRLG
ncbi:MAG: crossover junction endodeoxyribonuclease RuvC [Aquiluna sp.]|nr:crossover junction endodeoxyribonuclease RuvC [Aquiluna sp.]